MSILPNLSNLRNVGEFAKKVINEIDTKDVVAAIVAPLPFVSYKGIKYTLEFLTSDDESKAAPILAGLYNDYINGKTPEDETVRLMKEARNNDNGRIRGLYHFFMAVIYLNKAQNASGEEKVRQYNNAMTSFQKAAEEKVANELTGLFKNNNLEFPFEQVAITYETVNHFVHYKMGEIYEHTNDIGRARAEYIYAMSSDDYNYKKDAREGYIRTTNIIKTNFIKISEGARQYVLFAQNIDKLAGVYDDKSMIRWIFTIDDYPPDLIFSTQRPEANRLYILHPCRGNFYIAYDNYEEYIFNDKIKEFSYLCRCLGATSIEYENIKGTDFNESRMLNIDTGVGGKYKVFEGSVDVKFGQKKSEQHKISSRSFLRYKFPPLKTKAEKPNGLVWAQDPEEQELINMFQQGGLEERVWFFNSKNYSQRNNSVMVDVKASFASMMVKVSPYFDVQKDTTFSQQEEKEWKLSVNFKPEDLGLLDRFKSWFKHLFGIK